ncbi:hypothetical protein MOQ72_15050 [Saccharopolyspora sp. K220]|uniref:hypothetical protein n=1 Tax=Saccharopolyspora soli TaxID=2926618 RepID=UPI001F58ACEC|nr:hypothetical protein [Saccharopolyspora soli]MCI2418757.1 hypothetical protein [Saccharopolyspora soli]
MSAETAGLAVFLRRTQWVLDDLAFRVGAGHLDPQEIDETSAALEQVVLLLREKRPPTVIDQSERTA